MNEQKDRMENSPAVDLPVVDPEASSEQIPGKVSPEVDENPGKTERLDQNALGEASEIGGGEPAESASCGDSSSDAIPAPVPASEDLEFLRGELTRLKAEISRTKESMERMDRECSEFHELYPNVSLSSLPDEVWEAMEKGIPLSAAYAYVDRCRQKREEIAKKSNLENSERSTGCIRNETKNYFSPAEVRSMTAEEVRKNYSLIMQSMSRWKY